jgi:hypothetical protein
MLEFDGLCSHTPCLRFLLASILLLLKNLKQKLQNLSKQEQNTCANGARKT